ncbi:hypothetical protein ACWIDW_04925 [Microbacterium sp. NPDC055312]
MLISTLGFLGVVKNDLLQIKRAIADLAAVALLLCREHLPNCARTCVLIWDLDLDKWRKITMRIKTQETQLTNSKPPRRGLWIGIAGAAALALALPLMAGGASAAPGDGEFLIKASDTDSNVGYAGSQAVASPEPSEPPTTQPPTPQPPTTLPPTATHTAVMVSFQIDVPIPDAYGMAQVIDFFAIDESREPVDVFESGGQCGRMRFGNVEHETVAVIKCGQWIPSDHPIFRGEEVDSATVIAPIRINAHFSGESYTLRYAPSNQKIKLKGSDATGWRVDPYGKGATLKLEEPATSSTFTMNP